MPYSYEYKKDSIYFMHYATKYTRVLYNLKQTMYITT